MGEGREVQVYTWALLALGAELGCSGSTRVSWLTTPCNIPSSSDPGKRGLTTKGFSLPKARSNLVRSSAGPLTKHFNMEELPHATIKALRRNPPPRFSGGNETAIQGDAYKGHFT